MEKDRRRKERRQEDIEKAWKELQRIAKAKNDPSCDPSLSTVTEQLNGVKTELSNAQDERKQAIKEHQSLLSDLEIVFDVLVKHCITEEYEGTLRLTEDELEFQILHGNTGSGEGFEMLAILLGDLSLAILGAAGVACHPGIVIHDSPREADLGPLAYQHYLNTMDTTLDSIAGSSGVPLQYIVTTTTPPPRHLRANAHTPLKLGGKHGLLFGKALKTARPRQVSIPGLTGDETKKKADEAKTGGGK